MATTLRWTLGALAAVLLISSPVLAQVQKQTQQPGQALRQTQPGQQRTAFRPQGTESMADHEIATWLVLCNEVEVHLGQFALKQAHNPDVKQFAEMMVQQHTALDNQLRQFAPDAPRIGGGREAADTRNESDQQYQAAQDGRQNVERRRGVEQRQTAEETVQPGQNHGLPMIRICQQLAERSYTSAKQELGRKQGAKFDMGYIGCQLHEHEAMLNTLEVLKPYASAPLQQVIEQAIPQTQQHMARARQIGEELWGDQEGKTEQGKTSRRDNDRDDQQDR